MKCTSPLLPSPARQKGSPFFHKGNLLSPLGYCFVHRGNPLSPAGNCPSPGGNLFVHWRNCSVHSGNPLSPWGYCFVHRGYCPSPKGNPLSLCKPFWFTLRYFSPAGERFPLDASRIIDSFSAVVITVIGFYFGSKGAIELLSKWNEGKKGKESGEQSS